MKKFLSMVVVIIVLLLISGYIENSYCHYWTTTPPIGADDEYIKTTRFCKLNAPLGLIGGLMISMVR